MDHMKVGMGIGMLTGRYFGRVVGLAIALTWGPLFISDKRVSILQDVKRIVDTIKRLSLGMAWWRLSICFS